MKNWPELKLMRDIQIFFGFANFYQCFIQSFNKIARPLILIFRTNSVTRLSKNLVEVNEIGVGDGVDNCEDKTNERSLS